MKADGSHPLIGALEAEVAGEVAALLHDAEAEAARILSEARREALRRFGAAARALRSERGRAVARAQAQAASARHQVYLAENARFAEAGLDDIHACLTELWSDAEARAAWCRNAIALTCARMGDVERFTVEHPDPLPAGTREIIFEAMSEACCRTPDLRPDPGLKVGLRLVSEHACLDATLDGLLQDRERIAGEYLALLGRGGEAGDG